MLELANQVKDLLQTGSYDDLMGPKVPMLKSNILNLLKIIDVSEQEKMQLVRMGLGDVFSQQIRTVGQVKEALNLKLEQEDPLKASTIYFQFLVFKTGNTTSLDILPKRVFFQLRFFTFPEIQTDVLSLKNPANNPNTIEQPQPGMRYLLAKEKVVETADGRVQRV